MEEGELELARQELAVRERRLELDSKKLDIEEAALKAVAKDGTRRKPNAAIWIALLGAFVTSIGYLVGFYQSLSLQKSAQNHALLVDLLSESPTNSSSNLLWAYDAKLLELTDQTVATLKTDPSSAPTRVAPSSSNSVAFDEIVPTNDVVALVRGLDGLVRSTRSASLQALLDEHRANESAVKAAIYGISGDQLDALSASGRVNILYFLERVDWCEISPEARTSAVTAVDTIIQRADEGVAAAGEQTRSHIKAIKMAIGDCAK